MTKNACQPPLLSRRQEQLVETIAKLTADRGYPPSMREVATAMNVSFGRVGQLARTTEAKGAIARDPNVARSWRVVHPAALAKSAIQRRH